MDSMRIMYSNGSTQVVRPSSTFDKRYDLLALQIAEGREHTYKILKK